MPAALSKGFLPRTSFGRNDTIAAAERMWLSQRITRSLHYGRDDIVEAMTFRLATGVMQNTKTPDTKILEFTNLLLDTGVDASYNVTIS